MPNNSNDASQSAIENVKKTIMQLDDLIAATHNEETINEAKSWLKLLPRMRATLKSKVWSNRNPSCGKAVGSW